MAEHREVVSAAEPQAGCSVAKLVTHDLQSMAADRLQDDALALRKHDGGGRMAFV